MISSARTSFEYNNCFSLNTTHQLISLLAIYNTIYIIILPSYSSSSSSSSPRLLLLRYYLCCCCLPSLTTADHNNSFALWKTRTPPTSRAGITYWGKINGFLNSNIMNKRDPSINTPLLHTSSDALPRYLATNGKNFYGTTASSIETLEPGSLANGRARSISDNSRVHTILSKMSPNSRLRPNPSPFRTLQDSFTYGDYSDDGAEKYAPPHEVFEKVCKKYPNFPAVEENGVTYTYNTILQRANLVTKSLKSINIVKGSVVAIYVNRGINVYVAMLGILKANCSYVPIDTSFPQSRVLFTLKNSGAAVIVREDKGLSLLLEGLLCSKDKVETGSSKAKIDSLVEADLKMIQDIQSTLGHVVVSDGMVKKVSIGIDSEINQTNDTEIPALNYVDAEWTVDPKIAYIIYTSGTTGTPKGVMVSVKNASHYIAVLKQLFASSSSDRVFQGYSTAFDASFGEIWMAFSGGASLVVGTQSMMQSGSDLKDVLRDLRISILDTTPTNLTIMGDGTTLPNLRIVIVGGEQCTEPVVKKWQPGRRFFNMYGPTETTVSATCAELFANKPVSIGTALPGYTVSIRDESMREVRPGNEGELCIGGAGVTLGYLNSPSKTAAKFVFLDGSRLYKTGDLVREDETGSIVFIGRADSQVKIRGYRVELEDIETHLNEVTGCKSVVVAVQRNPVSNAQELIAFVVTEPEVKFNPTKARIHLRTVLPKYMLPNAFVKISIGDIPHSNISGKVLRGKLPYWSTLELLVDPKISFDENDIADKEKKEHLPLTGTEHYVAGELLHILQIDVPMTENIFDYGFNSVSGALLISRFRNEKAWGFLKMKDVYEYTTPRALAAYIDSCTATNKLGDKGFDIGADVDTVPLLRNTNIRSYYNIPRKCLVPFFQIMTYIWFAILLNLGIIVQQGVLLNAPTWIFALQLLCMPLLIPPMVLLQSIVVKYCFIGEIVEGDYPLYSLNYFRWWLLQRLAINPLYIPGHSLAVISSRLFGSKIGDNVYLGCTLFVESDLVEIGDNVTLQSDSVLQTWIIENRILKLRKIKIGNNVYVGERSTISLGSVIRDNTVVHPLSITAKGSKYPADIEIRGAPGKIMDKSYSSVLGKTIQSLKLNAQYDGKGRKLSVCNFFVQFGIVVVVMIILVGISSAFAAPISLFYLYDVNFQRALDTFDALVLLKYAPLCALLQQMFTVGILCLIKRLVSGNSSYEGVIRIDSYEYLRRFVAQYTMRMLMTGPSRGLTETVFMRFTLRYGMGLDVGEGSEIDVSNWGPKPELVKVGKHCMINGGALLGIAPIFCGQMLLEKTRLHKKTFLGNMSVVPQGSILSENSLLGVMSVSPKNMEAGSTYLGSPSFKLPSRQMWGNRPSQYTSLKEDVPQGVDLTFNPPCYMRVLRFIMNLIKIITQMTMVLVILLLYMTVFNAVDDQYKIGTSINILVPLFWKKFLWWLLISLSYAFVIVLICALGKWIIVCKYTPIQVPMWSCFIWRSDIAYEMEIFMRGAVRVFDGTPYINLIYRLFGVDIGSDVFLFSPTFMEHDLTHIGDGSVITGGTLQTHLYEDRYYKTGHVVLSRRTLVAPGGFALYDSEMGQYSSLSSHSLLMRNEKFEKNSRYFGLPSTPSNTHANLQYEEALGAYKSTLEEYNAIEERLHDARIALHDARARC